MDHGSAPRRFRVGFNVLIQVLLVAVILIFVNVIVNRWHPRKIDLTRSQYYKLSDKTLQLIKNLKEPVDVIVFFQPDSEDAIVDRVFRDIQRLLKEYTDATQQVRVRFVDPNRDAVGAEKLATDYGVKVPNVVVFAQGKRSKFVNVNDLVEFEPFSPYKRGAPRMKFFKGEQQFTSALQNVIEEKQAKVYFLQGHGEGDFENFEKKGFSTLAKYILRDNLLVEKLNIFEKQQVPKDCDVLVVCGPSKTFNELELKSIQDYLTQNGRLMVLLDGMRSDTGMEKFLTEYGVKVGNDVVLCEFLHLLQGKRLEPIAPGAKYGHHPVTEKLRKEQVEVILPMARTVDRLPAADASKARVTVLVETSAESWAETDFQKLREGKAVLDEKDRKGPVPVAVAVEPNTAGEMEREGMRLVVFGSSTFINNDNCGAAGNMDLFLNALNWLLKRQQLIGIAAKMPQEFSLALSEFQMRAVFVTEVIVVPLAAAVLGLLVWIRRRR